jgi:hypothetical protein
MEISAQAGRSGKQPGVQGLVGVLTLLFGIGTIFVLVVSVSDAWREHTQRGWPEATATIRQCSVERYIPLSRRNRAPVWHIECRISYRAGSDPIETQIRSGSLGTPLAGGSPEEMRTWVAAHPRGGTITVHYDPGEPRTAVLTETDMPAAGPRTPSNLKLLLIAAAGFLGLMMLARRLNR